MFDFSQSLFTQSIPDNVDIVFISDMFVDDYVGGAELTTEALIKASQFRVYKLRSKDVTMSLLEQGHKKFWIFGNFASINFDLIPSIIANMQYSIIEYDYKFCKYRSSQKHSFAENVVCNCHNEPHGKLISSFFYGARSLWWMSEKQQEKYLTMFPFLGERPNFVLSSVFDDQTFVKIKLLRDRYKNVERKKWLCLGSQSWIKGADAAIKWCKENGKEHDVLWGLSYDELLERLAQAEGHVYLPPGGDTCPRMVIEAQLLGCKLHLNENVEHAKEEWFDTDDITLTEAYLYAARDRFWAGTKSDMEFVPTISGYVTTLNCIKQEYPFEQSIMSLLGFCDEVVVVDGGSSDGTWERLIKMAEINHRVKPTKIERDWSAPGFALFDGMQKAEARKLCTGTFCWQQDVDEVVHERDYEKIRKLIERWPAGVDMVALPILEFWGGSEKIRVDTNCWKWRLSRNVPNITHGVPRSCRRYDENGNMHAAGSDGCDPIDAETFEPVPFMTFVTAEHEQLRRKAIFDHAAAKEYEKWLGAVASSIPTVQHFSWIDIARKIRLYRDYWETHWNVLFGSQHSSVPETNMFFGKSWSDVTDVDINALAHRLATEMGGWVFHRPIDFAQKTNSVKPSVDVPALMKAWVEEHSTLKL